MFVQLTIGMVALLLLYIITSNVLLLLFLTTLLGISLLVLLLKPAKVSLNCERLIEFEQVTQGSKFNVTVKIKNNGSALHWVFLEDTLPAGISVLSGKAKWWFTLASGEEKEFLYTCNSTRGLQQWSELKLHTADFLGMAVESGSLKVQSQILVFPQWQPVKSIPLNARRLFGYGGYIEAKRSGGDGDFYGIRPFVNGDSLRQVHWRASAKQNELFVREKHQRQNTTVNIVVDARISANQLDGTSKLFDRSLSCAVSLADQCLRAGQEVAVSFVGSDSLRVPAGVGRRHFERILYAMATANLGNGAGLERYQARFFKEFGYGGCVFWVSPLEQTDLVGLKQLKACGYSTFAFSPNLLDSIENPETQQFYLLKRKLLIKGMSTSGVPVLDWDLNSSLPVVVGQLQRLRRAS